MLKRYEKCVGISFPAIGRYKIEIWTAPKGYCIEPHTHNNEDIKLLFLFGHNVTFWRKRPEDVWQKFKAKFWNIGRVFNIRAGDIHSFDVSNTRLVFLNLEIWKVGVKPTSASEDFQKY